MKNIFYLILIIITLSSCLKEPEFYHSRLYPVSKSGENWTTWENNEIFDDAPISFRLESRIDFKDHESICEGQFEPINFGTTFLTSDKDIYYLEDTIKKGKNLLDYDLAEIETYRVTRGSGTTPDSYIFWVNKEIISSFYSPNTGFFTFYVSSETENNYQINDSTVIKIK